MVWTLMSTRWLGLSSATVETWNTSSTGGFPSMWCITIQLLIIRRLSQFFTILLVPLMLSLRFICCRSAEILLLLRRVHLESWHVLFAERAISKSFQSCFKLSFIVLKIPNLSCLGFNILESKVPEWCCLVLFCLRGRFGVDYSCLEGYSRNKYEIEWYMHSGIWWT